MARVRVRLSSDPKLTAHTLPPILGVNFGIYSDEGTKTCGGYPGSKGYEQVDADTFASWGVDVSEGDCTTSQASVIVFPPPPAAVPQARRLQQRSSGLHHGLSRHGHRTAEERP
jgi:hypothetical protein